MSPLAEKIPLMSDADLTALRVNAQRLVQHGLPQQIAAAADILPLIDEAARRAALPRPPAVKPARAPRRRATSPASGHQTALPSLSKDP
jgi:hypothetical protein